MATMKRIAILCLLFLATGCSKPKPEGGKPAGQSSKAVILSTQVAPNSPFKMSISFDPAQPLMSKKTKFHVKLADLSGVPAADAQVKIALVMPLMDMGKNEFSLASVGPGEYEGMGQFTMSGEWEVVVNATAGAKTGKTTFNVRVED